MKRLITAVTAAGLLFPAGALARTDAPPVPQRSTEAAVTDHQAPIRNFGVAVADQVLPPGDPVPVPASGGSDFDFADAGIGAGSAICLAAVSLGSLAAFRRRRTRASMVAG